MRNVVLFWLVLIAVAARAQQQTSSRPLAPPTDESRWLVLLFAVQGGGGWQAGASPTAYGGMKMGLLATTLDLGYDRVHAQNGFSMEFSEMLPILRYPRPQEDWRKDYLRIYAEPGIGYRTAGTGGYFSAKVMFVLFSDERIESNRTKWSPYIEAERRFPFNSLLNGDNRISFGLIYAICQHCGPE